jgi:hypothetical protein
MTTKVKAPPPNAGLLLEGMRAGPWPTPPWTMAERLQRIEAMGNRINSYIRFICQAGSLGGSSDEAKEKAVSAFYERLAAMESQLDQIQEGLRLG